MNKIEGLDISYTYKKLDNGLEVILVEDKNIDNYFISYATKYGSEITEFTPNGEKKLIKVPEGIAHFLEHKLFEEESGIDPFTYFAKSGTDANASTSYDNTRYICYGTNNFNDNLKYLIEFVNRPYFTDKNVEKEKGIIAEELKMYMDYPDYRLELKLRENLYHQSKRKNDIGGTVDTIQDINKENLMLCYNNFYSPSNMFIIAVGNFKTKEALKIIEEVNKDRKKYDFPKIKEIKEKINVVKKYDEITSSININKLAVGIKLDVSNIKLTDIEKRLYLNIILDILFGETSNFKEYALINDLYRTSSFDIETIPNIMTFYLFFQTEKEKELLEYIKEILKNIKIEEHELERKKKTIKAELIRQTDNANTIHEIIYHDMIKYGKIIDNKMDIINKLNIKKLNSVIKKLDFNNMSVVLMKKEK